MSFPRGAELAEALRRVIGGDVRFDSYTRHLFSRDASMYTIEPIGVVFPRDSADVAAVVSTAAEFGVPVLPRGAGTSLAGQTVGQAIVMDLSRHMNKIIEIDAEQRVARVQPGVVQEQLNLAGARHGLLFGPDTSTKNRATLGGMIGNNSAGSQSVRYGMTIDHVLALDVVLSDASQATFGPLTAGELLSRAAAPTLDGRICRELPRLVERHREAIVTGFPRFWRSGGYRLDRLARSTGLDLAKFVVGSEGTLVTVVGATVQLVPAPRYRVIAVGHFTSVQAAIEATEDALACQPAAVELLDRTIIELSRRKIEYASLGSILHGDPEALLFVTFFGDTMAEAVAGLDRLDEAWRAHGHGYHTLRAVDSAEQAALLKVREAGLGQAAQRCRPPVHQPGAGVGRSPRCCCPAGRRHWRLGRLENPRQAVRRIQSSDHVPVAELTCSALIPATADPPVQPFHQLSPAARRADAQTGRRSARRAVRK